MKGVCVVALIIFIQSCFQQKEVTEMRLSEIIKLRKDFNQLNRLNDSERVERKLSDNKNTQSPLKASGQHFPIEKQPIAKSFTSRVDGLPDNLIDASITKQVKHSLEADSSSQSQLIKKNERETKMVYDPQAQKVKVDHTEQKKTT